MDHSPTNGQVERMSRTIKQAGVKRFHDLGHDQLRTHFESFIIAYNFARRLKTLTPYELICKRWMIDLEKLRIDPIQQMPGLNTEMTPHCSAVLFRAGRFLLLGSRCPAAAAFGRGR